MKYGGAQLSTRVGVVVIAIVLAAIVASEIELRRREAHDDDPADQ